MKRLLSIFLILGLLTAPAFAQEAARDKIFILNDFSGGLATKINDQTTPSKYAQIAENCRLDVKLHSITKRSQLFTFGTPDTTEPITSLHRLYLSSLSKYLLATHGDELEVADDTTGVFTAILALTTSEYRWKWVTWHDLAIGGDGYNYSVKTNGVLATHLGTCAAADAGSGAGPNGTYKYKIAFYTATYTVIFDVPSSDVTVSDNDISLTMIPIGPTTYLGEDIVGRKVYRNTVAAPTTWNLLSNGTIANNTATTLTDSDADGAVGAAYPTADDSTIFAWTPPKCKFWVIHKNRLFGANTTSNPSRVYYSKDGSHDLFETAIDYVDIRANDGDEVTGLFNLLGILRIPKTNTWQSMYTSEDDPASGWSVSEPLSFVGCDAPYSAVLTPRGIIYLSKARNGIYTFNGQASQLISDLVTPVISDISNSNLGNVVGEYNNNLYYMAYTSAMAGGSINNRILVYDAVGNSSTIDTLNINAFCSLSGGTDGGVLFGGASDSGKVYQFASAAKEILHKTSSDFTGTFDDARVVPQIAGGDLNNPTIELAWDLTINGMAGTINAATGIIDRPDTGGTYTSTVINTQSASTYDKIYWREVLASGEDVTFAIRSGATSAACQVAAWSSEFSSPGGSDISEVTANEYTQYRITLSTGSTSTTPNVNSIGGYAVKLTYNTVGASAETSIPLHWQTGYLDFQPGYIKSFRKIIVSHSGTTGTLVIKFTNEYEETDTFNINLDTSPTRYEERFTSGVLTGNKFKIDILNSDLADLEIKEILIVFDLEPIV